MSREAFEKTLPEMLETMGIRALRQSGMNVLVDEERDSCRVRIALPMFWSSVQIEYRDRPEFLVKKIDDARESVCVATMNHIAKYYRSPVDRLEQIERAVQKLIDALDTLGAPSGILKLTNELTHLLKCKPGSPAWSPTGYGVVEVKP
jgi:hypothetical protein